MGLKVKVATIVGGAGEAAQAVPGLIRPEQGMVGPEAWTKIFALIGGTAIRIKYVPEPGDLSTKIVFLQVMRNFLDGVLCLPSVVFPGFAFRDKDTTLVDMLHVDYINGENDPYYNGDDPADKSAAVEAKQGNALSVPPRSARMRDEPNYPDGAFPAGKSKLKWEFRTAAFSAAGKDAGSYYRFVDWTYSKEKGKPSRLAITGHGSDPGPKFTAAVDLWCGNHGFVLPTPPPPGEEEEVTYVVQSGDYLTKIAQAFYGDGALWRKIYDANRDVIGSNPNLIYPGQELVIPEL